MIEVDMQMDLDCRKNQTFFVLYFFLFHMKNVDSQNLFIFLFWQDKHSRLNLKYLILNTSKWPRETCWISFDNFFEFYMNHKLSKKVRDTKNVGLINFAWNFLEQIFHKTWNCIFGRKLDISMTRLQFLLVKLVTLKLTRCSGLHVSDRWRRRDGWWKRRSRQAENRCYQTRCN